jgi:hypothetical protein
MGFRVPGRRGSACGRSREPGLTIAIKRFGRGNLDNEARWDTWIRVRAAIEPDRAGAIKAEIIMRPINGGSVGSKLAVDPRADISVFDDPAIIFYNADLMFGSIDGTAACLAAVQTGQKISTMGMKRGLEHCAAKEGTFGRGERRGCESFPPRRRAHRARSRPAVCRRCGEALFGPSGSRTNDDAFVTEKRHRFLTACFLPRSKRVLEAENPDHYARGRSIQVSVH